jgi:hypothetical protein
VLISPLKKAYAAVTSVALCLAVASPVRRHLGDTSARDSFPLSTYPMFSKARPELEPATYVIALEEDGTRHFVRYTHWASGGWNQGRAQVHRYKKGKAGGPQALCERVARSLSEVEGGWPTQAVEVRMVWGEYDVERWFVEDHQLPSDEKTLHACPVPR